MLLSEIDDQSMGQNLGTFTMIDFHLYIRLVLQDIVDNQ